MCIELIDNGSLLCFLGCKSQSERKDENITFHSNSYSLLLAALEIDEEKQREVAMPRMNNNNSAAKVGEIFREAGVAFNKLSEMTNLLHPIGESQPGGKWTEEEIDMLRSCVHRFAVDLNKLSQHIKNRTVSQIRTTLKKKAFEDAGIPVRQVSNHQGHQQQSPQVVSSPMTVVNTQSVLGNSHIMGNSHSVIGNALNHPQSPLVASMAGTGGLGKNAEVTLNMLNATENEVDVEGLSADGVKLEFEANNDEVAS